MRGGQGVEVIGPGSAKKILPTRGICIGGKTLNEPGVMTEAAPLANCRTVRLYIDNPLSILHGDSVLESNGKGID
jgi:hypothetical protein